MRKQFSSLVLMAVMAGISAPATAQFGKLGDVVGAIKGLEKAATQPDTEEPFDDPVNGVETDEVRRTRELEEKMKSGEIPDFDYAYRKPEPVEAPYTKLPDEFRQPNPSLGEPILSVASIKKMYARDLPGVKEVIRLAIVRDPGALWKIRKNYDGEIIYLDASITIHEYVRLTDNTCMIALNGAYVRKPYAGYGNFSGAEVASTGTKGQKVPCDWK
jgi:hypothetical protein